MKKFQNKFVNRIIFFFLAICAMYVGHFFIVEIKNIKYHTILLAIKEDRDGIAPLSKVYANNTLKKVAKYPPKAEKYLILGYLEGKKGNEKERERYYQLAIDAGDKQTLTDTKLFLQNHKMKKLVNDGEMEEAFKQNSQFIRKLTLRQLNKYPIEVCQTMIPVLHRQDGNKYIVSQLEQLLQDHYKELSPKAELYYLGQLGVMYGLQNEYMKAINCFVRSIGLAKEENDNYALAKTVVDLASVLKNMGETEYSVELVEEALTIKIANDMYAAQVENYAYSTLIEIALQSGKLNKVEKYLDKIRSLSEKLPANQKDDFIIIADMVQIYLLLSENRIQEVESHLKDVAMLLQQDTMEHLPNKDIAYVSLVGKYYQKVGNKEAVVRCFEKASQLAEERGMNHIQLLHQLANSYEDVGNQSELKRTLNKLVEAYKNDKVYFNTGMADYILDSIEDEIRLYNLMNVRVRTIKAVVAALVLIIIGGIFIWKWIQRLKKKNAWDGLTGLPNYNHFRLLVSRYIHNNEQALAAVSFDIKHLKIINITYGYEVGDEILKEIALILQNVLPEGTPCGRLRGDIFGFIAKEEDVQIYMKQIKNRIALLSIKELDVSSIRTHFGVYYLLENENDIKLIFDWADMARLKAKEDTESLFTVFHESMIQEQTELALIEEDLWQALDRNEMFLQYQPKYNISTEQIVGVEALIRWNHPNLGLIRPDKFIKIAERNGFINEIGQWVFQEVCKTNNEWRENGLQVVPIAINISRIELHQKEIVPFMKKKLEEYHIAPNMIEIEITESVALDDIQVMKEKINQMKALGLVVSIDDFGTGNSNFVNLKHMNINTIKIDRSLFSNIENDKKSRDIVDMIIQLSAEWDLDVVCEGIETTSQMNVLKKYPNASVQGFVFSKPLDKKAIERSLRI